MSNNKDTNKIEPKFNEAQAYEELRMIFVIAIETQNFNGIEEKIAAWENKYPLADFTNPEIIRKIKAILNFDFAIRPPECSCKNKNMHKNNYILNIGRNAI